MDIIAIESIERCIQANDRLLDLQDQDIMNIEGCLRGDQVEAYKKMSRIEREKLENLKRSLQSLCEAETLLP